VSQWHCIDVAFVKQKEFNSRLVAPTGS